jgi:hypothetical protein
MDLGHPIVGVTEEKRVFNAFREVESLLVERYSAGELSPIHKDGRQRAARQDHLKLRRRTRSDPPFEFDRPARGPFYRRRSITLIRCEWRYESGLEQQFLLIALGAFGNPPKGFEASFQTRNGFEVCRTLGRSLSGSQPVMNRFFEKPRFGQVPREKLRLSRNSLGKIGFENGGDAGVQLLAAATQKTAIGGVSDERVFEEIGGVRAGCRGRRRARPRRDG